MYMQVPGTAVTVCAKDLYDTYVTVNQGQEILAKKQIGKLVTAIVDKVEVIKTSGKYRGLRLNFASVQDCDKTSLNNFALQSGFIQLKNCVSSTTYGLCSGDIVNNNEYMKTITITDDPIATPTVSIGGRTIDMADMGLTNIAVNTTIDANIIFNTVKQATVCRGKPVKSKLNTTKYTLVQEWMKRGDENSLELRLSAKNCNGVAPLTGYKPICVNCQHQKVNKPPSYGPEPPPPKNEPQEREYLVKTLFQCASELMITTLHTQSKICTSNSLDKYPRSRRWDKEIIQVALTLWNRSPQGYASLKDSGMLFLPSDNLLQRYKNCFEQHPGLNDNMFTWMYNEANRFNADKHGGLVVDEMAIQDDLKMAFADGKHKVDGSVDMGEFADNIHILNSHTNEARLATHVLQFLFLSYDGFRFPFAYFPTIGANTPELYITIWESISKLSSYDFVTDYVCLDGASNNRAFQMMHFKDKEDAKLNKFTTSSPFAPTHKVTLMMDYSHNIKKLRNNINSSGDHESCTRKLKLDGQYIVWEHWIQAFNWDRNHNPVRVHRKLTNEHVFLTNTSKMRNHLAEHVLDKDMLHLMRKYQQSLKNGAYLDKTIELLEHTSTLIETFRDRHPICDLNDPRLSALCSLETWLQTWADHVSDIRDISASERAKQFISRETYSDFVSMTRGFPEVCKSRINVQKRSIVPAGINSDVIENFFCQQRTVCHGSNTNPTVHQYKYGINSTILGQNAVSKKSNAASKRKSVEPFSFSTPGPLNKAKCIRL